MTRAQIEDLEAFAEEVATRVRRDGVNVEQAVRFSAEPHILPPHGCHRDGDSIHIGDLESGETSWFTKNDQGELWVSASHRNGARVNPEQFLWLTRELSPWLNGRDLTAVEES